LSPRVRTVKPAVERKQVRAHKQSRLGERVVRKGARGKRMTSTPHPRGGKAKKTGNKRRPNMK
jgi:hypothetical protein